MRNENVIWVNDWDDSEEYDGFYEENWIISANDIFQSFEYEEEGVTTKLPLAA